MARRSGDPASDPGLRAYLLEQAVELRALYTGVALGGGAAFGKYCWTELSKPVDRLQSGAAVMIRRYDLPLGHPQRAQGDPCGLLRLDERDVLHELPRA